MLLLPSTYRTDDGGKFSTDGRPGGLPVGVFGHHTKLRTRVAAIDLIPYYRMHETEEVHRVPNQIRLTKYAASHITYFM